MNNSDMCERCNVCSIVHNKQDVNLLGICGIKSNYTLKEFKVDGFHLKMYKASFNGDMLREIFVTVLGDKAKELVYSVSDVYFATQFIYAANGVRLSPTAASLLIQSPHCFLRKFAI